jgi:hypothetical protein
VRRSSDNAEQNIGFDGSGNLDTSSLTSFCSGTNGFVTTWYDQSENGKNITQSTASNQPQIVSGGSVITKNSKPCCQFTNANNQNLINNSVSTASAMSFSWVGAMTNPLSSWYYAFEIGSYGATTGYVFTPYAFYPVQDWGNGNLINLGNGYTSGRAPRFVSNTIPNVSNAQTLYNGILSSTNAIAYKNNTAITAATSLSASVPAGATTLLKIGSNTYDEAFQGTMQEIIFWGADQNSNISGINTNTNTYYGIY